MKLQEEVQVLGHSSDVTAIALTSDFLFTGARGCILQWALDGRHIIRTIACGTPRVILSSTFLFVSYYGEQFIELFDSTGTSLTKFEGHDDEILHLLVIGQFLISSSLDETVRVWNTQSWECEFVLKQRDSIVSIGQHHEQLVTGCAEGVVRIWDLLSGNSTHQIDVAGGLVQFRISGDLLFAATKRDVVLVYNLQSDETEPSRVFAAESYPSITCLEISGNMLCWGTSFGAVIVRNFVTDEAILTQRETDGPVQHVALAGHLLFCVGARIGDECPVRVYDLVEKRWAQDLSGHKGTISQIVATSNFVYTISEDRTARAWPLAERQVQPELSRPEESREIEPVASTETAPTIAEEVRPIQPELSAQPPIELHDVVTHPDSMITKPFRPAVIPAAVPPTFDSPSPHSSSLGSPEVRSPSQAPAHAAAAVETPPVTSFTFLRKMWDQKQRQTASNSATRRFSVPKQPTVTATPSAEAVSSVDLDILAASIPRKLQQVKLIDELLNACIAMPDSIEVPEQRSSPPVSPIKAPPAQRRSSSVSVGSKSSNVSRGTPVLSSTPSVHESVPLTPSTDTMEDSLRHIEELRSALTQERAARVLAEKQAREAEERMRHLERKYDAECKLRVWLTSEKARLERAARKR